MSMYLFLRRAVKGVKGVKGVIFIVLYWFVWNVVRVHVCHQNPTTQQTSIN